MDRIALQSIRAYGRHGADPSEREQVQAFEIDILMDIDLDAAASSDDLLHTVDYAALHGRIVEIVGTTSYALLERLAADLLSAIFADRRVARAEVALAKPAILDGATPRITLRRTNPQALDRDD